MIKKIVLSVFILALYSVTYCQEDSPLVHDVIHNHSNGDCAIINPDSLVELKVFFNGEERARNITAMAKNGYAFIEGDILLGKIEDLKNLEYMRSLRCDEEIIVDNTYQGCGFWDDNIIPFHIDPSENYSQANIATILSAIETINNETNLCIVPRTDEEHYVNIIQDGGCYSYIGSTYIDIQPLSLDAPGCIQRGVIMHEFLHAAGIYHEQSREDRNSYVIVDTANVFDGFEDNFEQHSLYASDIGSYDYESIMHYGPYAFSKNGLPTITKLNGSTSGFGQREYLSAGDVFGVNTIYSAVASGSQQVTLEEIYDDNNGSSWYNSTGWYEYCSPCLWEGVTCNLQNITKLDLSSNNLTGSLANIDDLSELEELLLNGNELTDLPTLSTSSLPNLTIVNISGNDLNFTSLEGNFSGVSNVTIGTQGNFDIVKNDNTLSAAAVGGTMSNNTFTWKKNGVILTTITGNSTIDISDYFNDRHTISNTRSDDTYSVDVVNSTLPGLTISSNDIIAASPLPVSFTYFKGEDIIDGIELEWSTSSEVDNKGFSVQRSNDGIEFYTIGYVEGNGTSWIQQYYSFVDTRPFTGNNYYRLVQEDYDGETDNTEILIIRFTGTKSISIHPNLINDGTLNVLNGQGNIMKVVGVSGKLELTHKINNANESIDVSLLSSGVYYSLIGDKVIPIFIK